MKAPHQLLFTLVCIGTSLIIGSVLVAASATSNRITHVGALTGSRQVDSWGMLASPIAQSTYSSRVSSLDCGFYNVIEISDPVGDATPGAPSYVDIRKLEMRQMGHYVQFVWEGDGNLYNDDQQYYFLVIDTDFDPNTGQQWGGAGGELKIGIYHTADLTYFDETGLVVRIERDLPVLFEGSRFYLNIEKQKIPGDHFRLYFESSGGTGYYDHGSLNEISLQPSQAEVSVVLKSDEMILRDRPALINIPNKATEVELHTYLVQGGSETLLPPNQVTYSVYHPVHDPRLGDPSLIVSVDSNGIARYLKEGYIFVTAKLDACHLSSNSVILATGEAFGDPQSDNVIAVFPTDYTPESSSYSFGYMMTNHPNYMQTVNHAYDTTSDLYSGFRPFNGERQIFALLVMEGHCGGPNNPLETAPCCYMNCGDGTPRYNVVIHEMGHNFARSQGMSQLGHANYGRIFGAGFGECVASLPVIYFASEIYDNPGVYGITGDSFEWDYYRSFLQGDVPSAQSTLEDFEALINDGQTSGIFDNSGQFDGVAVFCSFFQLFSYEIAQEDNPYGNEMIRRFLNIFGDSLLPDFQEDKVETYFAAAYSYAVGSDMRSRLRFWGFTIDDEYYEMIYDKISETHFPILWNRTSERPDSASRGMKAAYDVGRRRMVVFGGINGGLSANTWEYDGTTWYQVDTPHTPPPRIWHEMTYDASRQVIVLFGGQQDGPRLNDTWEYDGTDWRHVNTVNSPSPREGFGMTYDSCRNKVVLWGGATDSGLSVETWEYDGSNWSQITTPSSPPGRNLTSMVFDSQRCRTVLFGGGTASYVGLSDTWEYDGNTWSQRNPSRSPAPRWAHAMVFGQAQGKVILFGGYGPKVPGGQQLGDTWAYDGKTWTRFYPDRSPEAREQHAMVYDTDQNRVVLFGGWIRDYNLNGDTWELRIESRVFLPLVLRNR